MGNRFLPMWPRAHLAFDPKAHARADYHTFGAAGEKLNVMDQTCQFSAGRPEHTMVHFSGHALNGGKQTLKRGSLPHK